MGLRVEPAMTRKNFDTPSKSSKLTLIARLHRSASRCAAKAKFFECNRGAMEGCDKNLLDRLTWRLKKGYF